MEVNIVERLLGLTLLGTEWVLWLLIAASIVSLAIMLERGYYFFATRLNFQVFSSKLARALVDNDVAAARAFARVNRLSKVRLY